MKIRNCTKEDFLQIHKSFEEFWQSNDPAHLARVRTIHHPLFANEFANTSYTIKEGEKVIAYLFGLYSQTEPTAYMHALCVHPKYKRKGLATRLVQHFVKDAKSNGCKHLKSLTSPPNKHSISFHKSLGMVMLGEPNEDGIPIVRDYSGPGDHRIVFWKEI
jgi:N-acetylglutamate synthase-like GNAT family acetyltransferase